MKFVSTTPFSNNSVEKLWDALKGALEEREPGFCWHSHPLTNRHGVVVEPDIVILHPLWGLRIIEVEDVAIENINQIDGDTWYLDDWFLETTEPFIAARKHLWSILDRLRDFRGGLLATSDGRCKISGQVLVAVPRIAHHEWEKKVESPSTPPEVQLLFHDDLRVSALRLKLSSGVSSQAVATEEEFQIATAVLTGSEALQRTPRRRTSNPTSRASKLRQVEERMLSFDLEQHRVAVSIPSGPQRIRGLAGTGKTVVLAMKAAFMHVRNPEWEIVFTFYSRSLYGQIKYLITRFVVHFSQGTQTSPDWDKIRVLHGWGASARPGVYSTMCTRLNVGFRSYDQALRHYSTRSAKTALGRCCEELLTSAVPEFFDAILVDEAQDFAPGFFRLCYHALRSPKRLIWGYDEVQSLEDLEIPTAESLFGTDENGNPLVDLSGLYAGDIEKDLILYHCYRNPRPVLVTAHAFGLGLLRPKGALQFIDTCEGWRDIGYEFDPAENGKLKAGQMVTLVRPKTNSPHLLEDLEGYRNLVETRVFETRQAELEWIANDIERNIGEEELLPHEIAVIAFDPYSSVSDLSLLQTRLKERGIASVLPGRNTPADVFRTENNVTLTHIYRAKGNEASVVYVYGFEHVWWAKEDYQTITRRNLAFTAMTRSKGWLILTGLGRSAEALFQEIGAIQEQIGKVTFRVPDVKRIQRNLETYENQRRRVRLRKAQQSLGKLLDDLKDVDVDLLPENQRRLLLERLLGRQKTDGEA